MCTRCANIKGCKIDLSRPRSLPLSCILSCSHPPPLSFFFFSLSLYYCKCTRCASIKGCQDERCGPSTCSVLAAWQALVPVCYRVFPLQSVALLCHHIRGTTVNTVLGKRCLQCVAMCHRVHPLQSVAFLRQIFCTLSELEGVRHASN